jgi:hypothetical protein
VKHLRALTLLALISLMVGCTPAATPPTAVPPPPTEMPTATAPPPTEETGSWELILSVEVDHLFNAVAFLDETFGMTVGGERMPSTIRPTEARRGLNQRTWGTPPVTLAWTSWTPRLSGAAAGSYRPSSVWTGGGPGRAPVGPSRLIASDSAVLSAFWMTPPVGQLLRLPLQRPTMAARPGRTWPCQRVSGMICPSWRSRSAQPVTAT